MPSSDTARETIRKTSFKPTSRRSSHHPAGHRASAGHRTSGRAPPGIYPGSIGFRHPHLADKAYSSRAIRSHLRRRGIRAVIPEPADQARRRRRRGSAGGRPITFDQQTYRLRNTVERAVNKLRGYRAVATRFDKRDSGYHGTVDVAAIGIWLGIPAT
jgi:transposase